MASDLNKWNRSNHTPVKEVKLVKVEKKRCSQKRKMRLQIPEKSFQAVLMHISCSKKATGFSIFHRFCLPYIRTYKADLLLRKRKKQRKLSILCSLFVDSLLIAVSL